jgi:hypothetical protein
MPAILQALDEIAFHTSMLALNAAVTAAGQAPAPEEANTQAARDTLALIEESITRARHSAPEVLVPVVRASRRQSETETLQGVAERIRRMRCPAPPAPTRRAAARNTRPFGETR